MACDRHHSISMVITTFTLLLFLSLTTATHLEYGGVRERGLIETSRERGRGIRALTERFLVAHRRRLTGPGSSPPACRSKCGRCAPCHPVHVPIQPGMSIPLEYYPEAWRCKCGNKLFMP